MPQDKLTLAACSFEVQPKDGRIQLLPYGEFRAIDGRPHDAPAWYLTEENGRDVVDLANASRNQLVVDYEHQTLHKEKNGQPAPAASTPSATTSAMAMAAFSMSMASSSGVYAIA